jgi:hypothetical protein
LGKAKLKEFQFECQRCGNCCNTIEGYTFLELAELFELSQKLKKSLKTLLEEYIEFREEPLKLKGKEYRFKFFTTKQKNGACVFLQSQKCSIYEFRPFQCRQFPFCNEILNNEKILKEIRKSCHGFGKGKKFTAEEIQQRLTLDNQFRLKVFKNSDFLNSLEIEKLINNIRSKIGKEGLTIDDLALQSIQTEILLKILDFYSQKFLNQELL